MSIFAKPIDKIGTADLQELLAESAIENIRLEFKLEDPSKDEALKKLTSFANTFGGYMLIGARADNNGRLLGLPGIQAINGLKQRLVQWGFEGTWPPLLLFVSDPVASPEDSTNVCYVVFVPESEEAPHFINGRKGVYVRTDEFSQRFEPRPATFDEIQHLANRRAIAIARRDRMMLRAESRFDAYMLEPPSYPSESPVDGLRGPILTLSVCPYFPSRPLIAQAILIERAPSCVVPWRGVNFPRTSNLVSQHESAIFLGADSEANYGHSFLEVNTWGLLFYAYDLMEEEIRDKNTRPEIHLYSLVGHILVSLEHARLIYSQLGFEGTLLLRTKLNRIRGVPLLMKMPRFPSSVSPSSASRLDDSVEFDITAPSNRLQAERDALVVEMIRSVMFALNHAGVAASEQEMRELLHDGYKYNYWPVAGMRS